MAELSPDELKAILDKLDTVCQHARELQRQVRQKMAEAARRDYPADPTDRRKTPRKRGD